MSKNFKTIYFYFSDLIKLINIFKELKDWEISFKNINGCEHICLNHIEYKEMITFPFPTDKYLYSTNISNGHNLNENKNILFTLYNDFRTKYESIFIQKNVDSNQYDLNISISFSTSTP